MTINGDASQRTTVLTATVPSRLGELTRASYGPQSPPVPVAFLSRDPVQVTYRDAGVEERLRRWFPDKDVTPETISALVGAPPRSYVQAETTKNGVIAIETDHAYYTIQLRSVEPDADSNVVLHHDLFEVEKSHPELRIPDATAPTGSRPMPGVGSRIVAVGVQTAIKLGIDRIELRAVGYGRYHPEYVKEQHEDLSGYYAWPQLGFEGPLNQSIRNRLPPHLNGARTVQQLVRGGEAGRQWWQDHGESIDLTFNLDPDGIDVERMQAYLQAKRIDIQLVAEPEQGPTRYNTQKALDQAAQRRRGRGEGLGD